MQGPSPTSFFNSQGCILLLTGIIILRASQGKKRQILPSHGNSVCILGGVSAPVFLIWFCPTPNNAFSKSWVSRGPAQWFELRSSPVHLTSAYALKDFSLHAPVTLLPLLAQGPFHHVALHSVCYSLLCLSFSFLPQLLQHSVLPSKSGNCPSAWISGMEDFGACPCLPSLKIWILFHFCPTVDMLNGLTLIGFHYAWAYFIVTGHENNGLWS